MRRGDDFIKKKRGGSAKSGKIQEEVGKKERKTNERNFRLGQKRKIERNYK